MSFIFYLEFCHFNSGYRTLVAFVSEPSSGTVDSLLVVVSSQQTVDYRNVLHSIEIRYALRYPLTDIIEMWCLAADYASEDDDSVESVVFAHLLCTVDEFETSWYSLDMYILRNSAVLLECLYSTVEERAGNIMVPLSDNDAEAHIAGVRNTIEIVI